MLLGDLEHFEEAIGSFQRAVALRPNFAQAHYNLGVAFAQIRQPQEAEQSYRQALLLTPNVPAIHSDLGDVLAALGRGEEAEQSYRRALALDPDFSLPHIGIGNLLRQRGLLKDAESSYRKALELSPSLAAAHSNLGLALFELGQSEEAEKSYLRALAIEPRLYEAQTNFGHMLARLGRLEQAERAFRQSLVLQPSFGSARSNLAFLLNHVPGRAPAEIYAEHLEFGRRLAAPTQIRVHDNARDPDRRLRIGYVSADLRDHSVAFFVQPILSKHDPREFELCCYYNYSRQDSTTQRLKSYVEHWHDVFGLPDRALADLIRGHAIDILIDLSGHTANNRLSTFALKPAPVQVTWLGYLNTTGLDAMDWRITDSVATPQGLLDSLHTERLVRMPDSQWCYQPPDRSPPVVPPPMLKAGACTFGVFSSATKINADAIKLWGGLLASVAESRLLVVINGLLSVPADYRERFTREGIPENRLEVLASKPFDEYLALHGAVDVMLDTFPYTGGTTTCHALWMGVPVVSLVGNTATSRGGASLLHAIGLSELVAESPDQYVDIARSVAREPERLASFRATLRQRMLSSPLTDATRFTAQLENTYRMIWRNWCASGQSQYTV
jgi:predicted O-linked N-acetylglucosamine transferase (SPINDLY family)